MKTKTKTKSNIIINKKEIRVAILGVGNCASSLVQGVQYYKKINEKSSRVPGLMHNVLGGYKIGDIKFVAAFDINSKKVGKDLSKAIFAYPNCTDKFSRVPNLNVKVQKGPVMDGVATTTKEMFAVDSEQASIDVSKVLRDTKPDVLINYLPVGSEKATKYYAGKCLIEKVAFINAIPVFIASDKVWADKFKKRRVPIIGDDVKSQLGATIVHRVLTKLLMDRGVKLVNTYQLNVGGNTDFLNMLERKRLKSKKISKTESVQSQLITRLNDDNIHIGPSDYVPWLNDKKIAFIRIEGKKFGNVPVNIEARLEVIDSPNSAGVVIDAIRCAKLALDRGIGGPVSGPSSYFMKHPLKQFSDSVAKEMVEDFIKGRG
ncbi:MAG: inositol-3-phosphate synthase [Patescibacteria group bacterium]|nr:inositol-3-phosphate synthase [Patescibacteria group bacterium]